MDLKGGILLGDGGYACSKLLLTPFRLSAQWSTANQKYNEAHIRTRTAIEPVFGQLKNKFRCCLNGIHINYENAVIAIAVLYNI